MSAQTDNLKMTLPTGTENITRSVINGNFEIVDAAVGGVQDGLAIVADGNTHAAIANGQFVYVRNHTTLAEGLYKATTAIGANVALTTSNLTANGSGGLNDLQSQVNTLNSNLTPIVGNKGRYRYITGATSYDVDLTQFGSYKPAEYQGFLVLTRYGLFYVYHFVSDGVQSAEIYPLYQTTSYSASVTMSNDGNTMTLTFGRTMYGGITVFG